MTALIRYRGPHQDGPLPVADALEGAIKGMLPHKKERNRYVLHRLQTHWSDIVGSINARHSGPTRLERMILYVDADGAVWSSELTMHKQEILDHIAAFLESADVKDLRFHVGRAFRRRWKPEPVSIRHDKVELPPLTEAEIRQAAAKLPPLETDVVRAGALKAEEKRAALDKLYRQGKIRKCPRCGAYLKDGGTVCFSCSQEYEHDIMRTLWTVLRQRPWVRRAADIRPYVACEPWMFDRVKRDLESFVFEKVRCGWSTPEEDDLAIQLKCHRPLDLISPKERASVLEYLRQQQRKKHYVRTSGHGTLPQKP
ncbi:MAG: hypothetical protein ACFWT7_00410 [Succiniclasticum sp.]|jgi:hypothetical protein